MNLAIIPARGGSKRLPRKNIREFAGRPMIAYAIQAARDAGLFDRLLVSTDDDEIAGIAREWGAEVPFMRPAELAGDHASTVQVIAHAIGACGDGDRPFRYICCIYPCVPLLRGGDIVEGLDLLKKSGADYCYPVTEFPAAIQRALRRDAAGRMSPFNPEHQLTRTQDLERAYHDAGQFYWGARQAWLTNPRILAHGAGLPIPNWRAVDIDTEDDWACAETIFNSIHSNRHSL